MTETGAQPAAVSQRLQRAGDARLVKLCRQGDEAAWSALVHRYERLVYSIPRKFRLTESEAADIFDAVFAELWRSLDRIQEPDRLRFWLGTVTRRQCLARLAEQRRLVPLPEPNSEEGGGELPDPSPLGDHVLIEAEREQVMRGALEQLTPRCRQVLEWLFFSEPPPSYDEVAKRLGLAANSIGFVRNRCLRKLRAAWEAELNTHRGARKT